MWYQGINIPSAIAGNRSATISWTAVDKATNYKVYLKNTSDNTYSEVTSNITFDASGTKVVITGLTNGKKYTFAVAAVDAFWRKY